MKILNKIIISLVLLNSVVFANSVGAITALQGSAFIVRDAQEIVATLGAKINEKDSIQTKDESKVQVVFDDETIITIGKNSSFSVNEYLFDESKAPTAKFGLVKGAMKTITGKIGKIAPDKFSVQTKTATIGIRGTNFTIVAQADGSSSVFCTFGAISVSVKGESAIVAQGFQISVSVDGKKSEPVKFTPAELSKAVSESFKASNNKEDENKENSDTQDETEASANTLSTSDAATQIDTTKTDNLDLLVSDITVQTTSAVQADIADSVDESATATTFNMSGYSLGYSLSGSEYWFNSSSTMSLKTLNTSTFDTENSFIKIGDWIFTPASAMGGAGTINDFSGTFATVSSTNYTNTAITSTQNSLNSFSATNDDLSSSDAMSWGSWNVTFTYEESGTTQNASHSGLWVAGENPTAESVIAGYNSTLTYTYDGKYKALHISSGSLIGTKTGIATLIVDFGANTASLTIGGYNNPAGADLATYSNMPISGNSFSTQTPNKANGTFYGSEGKSVAGSFVHEAAAGGDTYEGVYQVTTTATPQ